LNESGLPESTPKHPIEVWMQPVAASVIAASLPLTVGAVVRLFASRTASAWVVLVTSPLVVYFFAHWTAAVFPRFPVLRAAVVGLGPAAFAVAVLLRRRSSALAASLDPWAVLTWAAFNLACAVLAGIVVARRRRR
jgi:hypothetical protein